jgi:hypothetical protein
MLENYDFQFVAYTNTQKKICTEKLKKRKE